MLKIVVGDSPVQLLNGMDALCVEVPVKIGDKTVYFQKTLKHEQVQAGRVSTQD